jgi:hypothetical protein
LVSGIGYTQGVNKRYKRDTWKIPKWEFELDPTWIKRCKNKVTNVIFHLSGEKSNTNDLFCQESPYYIGSDGSFFKN